MHNHAVATITKWVVAFLIIFLLLMVLLLSFMYKKKETPSAPAAPRYGYR